MTTGPLPRMTARTVGPLRVDALLDGVTSARTAPEMLVGLPEGAVERHRGRLAPYLEGDRLVIAYQSFLVQVPGLRLLIDAAVGEDGEHASRPDWHRAKSDWLNHLGLAGLAPEDVDVVFLTHLHVDHTGWLTRRHGEAWRPTFPRARHLVSPEELAFWTERQAEFPYMERSVPDNVLPVRDAGLFQPVEPGAAIAPGLGLHVVDLAGHSPGMLGLEYREGGRPVAAFCADLMHHPIQALEPAAATRFCADPVAAVAARRRKLAEYAEAGTLVFCGHFPGESAGHLEPLGDGWIFRAAVEGPSRAHREPGLAAHA